MVDQCSHKAHIPTQLTYLQFTEQVRTCLNLCLLARKQEIIKVTEQLIEAINNGDFEAYTWVWPASSVYMCYGSFIQLILLPAALFSGRFVILAWHHLSLKLWETWSKEQTSTASTLKMVMIHWKFCDEGSLLLVAVTPSPLKHTTYLVVLHSSHSTFWKISFIEVQK